MPKLKFPTHTQANKLRRKTIMRLISVLLFAISLSLTGFAQEPAVFDVTGGGTFCEGAAGIPVGLTGSEPDAEYTLFRNGTEIMAVLSGTGAELSFGDQPAGTYTVSGTNGEGTTLMNGSVQVIENPLPTILITKDPSCTPDLLAYSVEITVSKGIVSSSSGTVNNATGNIWIVTDIPSGTDIIVTATDGIGCENTLPVDAPLCSCPAIAAPVGGGDVSFCESEPVPEISATAGENETVDWYDEETGGNLLLSSSDIFAPSSEGIYYAEARNTINNCVSDSRTAVIVTMNPDPIITLDCSDPDNTFYYGTDITFTATGGDIYDFLVDEIIVQSGTAFIFITNTLSDGQMVSVRVTNSSGCSTTSDGIQVSVIYLPSGWVINTGDFTYNGSVTAKVFIDLAPVDYGYLGAFSGTECRGIAVPVYYSPGDHYVFELECYSNTASGESLTFKYYDPLNDLIYDLNKTITFNSNMSVGDGNSPVEMHNPFNKIISFTQGWNWFSVNAWQDDMTLGNILSGAADGDYIKDQVSSATYNSSTGWFGSLSELNPVRLYKFKSNNSFNIEYPGVPVDINSVSINVVSGWNWIGFLPQASMPIEIALSSLALDDFDYIKNNSRSATYYKDYGWFGSLTELFPDNGYMMKLKNAGTLTYPGGYLKKGGKPIVREEEELFESSGFQHNGTLTASVLIDGNETGSENDILYAYVNDELRGVAKGKYFSPANNLVFTLMIHSNISEGEEVEFRYHNALRDKTYRCREKVVFKKEMIVGNAVSPYRLNVELSQTTSVEKNNNDLLLLNAYPNPFKQQLTIEYNLHESAKVRLRIFNTYGQQVNSLVDEVQIAGPHTVRWDSEEQPEGVYFIRLEAGSVQKVIKIMLVR
jgi:hypothetical protein